MKIAVVTGASSGLGAEFVRQIDRTVKPDAIWMIARRRERMEKVAKTVSCKTRILSLDLTSPAALDLYKETLRWERPEVCMLVNGAGMGKIGTVGEVSAEDCCRMIDLNCRALVQMTLATIPYMKSGSRILQISSTSAFQPFPGLNVYAATKAFVLRYSQALRWELWGKGIVVTAVCPYWVKDTQFISIAKENGSQAIRHFILASKRHQVVAWALSDSRMGFTVSTPGPICFLHRLACKIIPHYGMMAIWEGLRRV